MEAIRSPRNRWPAFGTLLVRDGAVTAEQLEQALASSTTARTPPRRDPARAGIATPLAISRVLAEQHELEFIELDFASIDPSAALLLPESLARRYRALPVRFLDDGSVLVAVADPTNVMFSDELRLAVGMPIRICVASPDRSSGDHDVNDAAVPIEEFVSDALESEDTANILDLHHDTPAVVFINRPFRRRSISEPPTSTSRRSSDGSSFASGSTESCAS